MSKLIARTIVPKSRPSFNAWMSYIHSETRKVSSRTPFKKIIKNKFG